MYKSIRNYKKIQLFPSKDWKVTNVSNFRKKFHDIDLLFFKNTDRIRYKKTNDEIEIAQRVNAKWSITTFIKTNKNKK